MIVLYSDPWLLFCSAQDRRPRRDSGEPIQLRSWSLKTGSTAPCARFTTKTPWHWEREEKGALGQKLLESFYGKGQAGRVVWHCLCWRIFVDLKCWYWAKIVKERAFCSLGHAAQTEVVWFHLCAGMSEICSCPSFCPCCLLSLVWQGKTFLYPSQRF